MVGCFFEKDVDEKNIFVVKHPPPPPPGFKLNVLMDKDISVFEKNVFRMKPGTIREYFMHR